MSVLNSVKDIPTFKILLVGDAFVGKTSLLIRFKDGIFLKGSYISTVGIDYKCKTIVIKGQSVRLELWDTAGQEKFKSITKSYYRDSDAVLFVYDLCKSDSFAHIKSWMSELTANSSSTILLVIVGNKLDEDKLRTVTKLQGEHLAKEVGALFWETSAKTGVNVNNLFLAIANQLIKEKTTNLSKSLISLSHDTDNLRNSDTLNGSSPENMKSFVTQCCRL